MAKFWHGSLINRLEENRMFCDKIEVGTGMTEYLYSDRHPYEVVEVTDQKHLKVRELDHQHVGNGCMDNNWKLISNPENPVHCMTKRGNYWYFTVTITSDILENLDNADAEKRFATMLWLCNNDIDPEKLKAKGEITKYHRANVSFGTAQYYYDYEF